MASVHVYQVDPLSEGSGFFLLHMSQDNLPSGTDMAFLLNSKYTKESGLAPKVVYRNLSPSQLYEMVRLTLSAYAEDAFIQPSCSCIQALAFEPGTNMTSTGALATKSGMPHVLRTCPWVCINAATGLGRVVSLCT